MSEANWWPTDAILTAEDGSWWTDHGRDLGSIRVRKSRLVKGERYSFTPEAGPLKLEPKGRWLCVRDYTGPDYVEPKPARPETLPVGTVVRPGPDWPWPESPLLANGQTGVVVEPSHPIRGYVMVSWAYAGFGPTPWAYRYGADGKYEVEPVTQPEAPPQAETAKPPSETVRVLRAALARAERGEIADVVVVARWLRNPGVREDIAFGMERGASVFVARGLLHTAATRITDGGREPMVMRIGDEPEDEA